MAILSQWSGLQVRISFESPSASAKPGGPSSVQFSAFNEYKNIYWKRHTGKRDHWSEATLPPPFRPGLPGFDGDADPFAAGLPSGEDPSWISSRSTVKPSPSSKAASSLRVSFLTASQPGPGQPSRNGRRRRLVAIAWNWSASGTCSRTASASSRDRPLPTLSQASMARRSREAPDVPGGPPASRWISAGFNPPAAAWRIESAVICQPVDAEAAAGRSGGAAHLNEVERLGRADPALLVQLQRAAAAEQVIRDERAGELERAFRPRARTVRRRPCRRDGLSDTRRGRPWWGSPAA